MSNLTESQRLILRERRKDAEAARDWFYDQHEACEGLDIDEEKLLTKLWWYYDDIISTINKLLQ